MRSEHQLPVQYCSLPSCSTGSLKVPASNSLETEQMTKHPLSFQGCMARPLRSPQKCSGTLSFYSLCPVTGCQPHTSPCCQFHSVPVVPSWAQRSFFLSKVVLYFHFLHAVASPMQSTTNRHTCPGWGQDRARFLSSSWCGAVFWIWDQNSADKAGMF